mgnify:CR=1 FL=1
MIPYSAEMFNDDVTLYRATVTVSAKGVATRTFPDAGIPLRASVQSRSIDRTDSSGRIYSVTSHWIYTPTDPAASKDDKFTWIGRTLYVESGSVPKGIKDVMWLTQCLETQ